MHGGGGYYLSLELNLCFHLSQNVPLWFQDRLGSTGLGVPPAPASLRLPEDAFSSRPGSWALPPAPPPTPIPAPQGLPHSPPLAWEVRGTERPVGVSACPGPGSPRLALAPDMLCPQGCLQRRPEVPSARRQAAAPRWAADTLRLCGAGGREGGAAVCLVCDCSGETPDSATVPPEQSKRVVWVPDPPWGHLVCFLVGDTGA